MRVSVEDALRRLKITPNYDPGGEGGARDCVHSFRGGLGAHWPLDEVRALMERYGVEEAGPSASAAGHGLVTIDDPRRSPVFWATVRRRGDA